jgi:plastocyanin
MRYALLWSSPHCTVTGCTRTIVEHDHRWGAEYKDDIRNGEWEYQAFGPDKKVNDKANLTACFTCHKPHAGQDFVISLAGLKGTPEGATAKPAPGPGVVSISDFKFGPETVVVSKGQTITWHNTDSRRTGDDYWWAQRLSIALKGQTTQMTLADADLRLHLRPAPGHEGQDRGQE